MLVVQIFLKFFHWHTNLRALSPPLETGRPGVGRELYTSWCTGERIAYHIIVQEQCHRGVCRRGVRCLAHLWEMGDELCLWHGEHSVILTLPIDAVDDAQTPDRR